LKVLIAIHAEKFTSKKEGGISPKSLQARYTEKALSNLGSLKRRFATPKKPEIFR